MGWVINQLLKVARPFALGHIYDKNGSLYMGRYALFECRFFAVRLHNIVRPDRDRHMHDHPWNFWSVVLQGGYVEARPGSETPDWYNGVEPAIVVHRDAGSIARRLATDRHIIIAVKPDTWTLFITGKYRNQWGFFTPGGKVPYREYLGLPPREPKP